MRALGDCFSILGPKRVSGPERGSVTLQCHYDSGWETYKKWWCRGADWGSCKILIITTGTEEEVKKGHISIRDNHKSHTFTVTMESLSGKDADIYWCGIARAGFDLGDQAEVTVDPAPTALWTTASTTNTFTSPAAPEETTGSPTLSSPRSNGRRDILDLSILLPLIFSVFLLLLVAASLLVWRTLKRQKKAAGMSSEQVPQPPEDGLCYTNLSLQRTGASKVPTRTKSSGRSSCTLAAGSEVEYITMAPFPKEDISYASLALDAMNQDPTYGNTGPLLAHDPAGPHEEATEYSTIRGQ
ncbi:CMRF35-like molecule 1 isoform X2 [Choloepus didactylus]|uniref:CMRF35-like molecule 1 isoform X2 n=1 Tax=Choloepus didactylus TaxID=27675 RepID=UPI00189D1ED8|nr:CMRF35-like molecule 1 isoform X2 [Choloepus didactylus]